MITVGDGCLVPGDEQEGEVRRRYGGWLAAGLAVVQELAERPQGEVAWPNRAGGPPRAAPVRDHGNDRLDLSMARDEGWLLTGPQERPVTGGPLAGLCVAVKDLIDVQGLPTRNGSEDMEPRRPRRSAGAWSVLADAGAWCGGKAATQEWAWGVTTPSIGNPFDRTRYAGGSSGGPAAAVAGMAVAAGLGTDTGGSIRIPASLCGVVGIRPTHGRVDLTGISPLAPEQDVVGPMAGEVSTAASMLEVLLARACFPDSSAVGGLRVGYLGNTGRLQPSVRADYTGVLDRLRVAGVELIEIATTLPRLATSISLLTMLTSSAELYALDVRRSPRAYGSQARALLTLGEGLDERDRLRRARRTLTMRTAELFAEHDLDAFLSPTTPCVAPSRGSSTVDLGGRAEAVDAALTRFTAWASATGLPAIAVPVGAGRLPGSVQFMAPPDREDTCLRFAQFIESTRFSGREGSRP